MNRTFLLAALLLLVATAVPSVIAQTPAGTMPPPNVLLVVREQLKPGKGASHLEESHRFTQVLRKANSPYHRIGMTAIAGDENEVLYIWPYQSFAQMEKANQDMEKWAMGPLKADFEAIAPGPEDNHISQHDMVAIYRPDLSYKPDVNIAEMRYMVVERMQVKPGQEGAFNEGAKLYGDALKKANLDSHSAIFQVVSGADQGLYLIFSPMKSLAEMDRIPSDMKAFGEAMGPEGMAKLEKLSADVFKSFSSSIYAFNPRMSYVADEFVNRDKSGQNFWNPKD
jgi:hypothetical protein